MRRYSDQALSGSQGRNITGRLAPELQANARRTLRQAWEVDGPEKTERLLRNLAWRLEHEAQGVSKTILEGLDGILTVSRLGLPLWNSAGRWPAPT